MRRVFIDSGYLVALVKKRDPYRAKALEVSAQLNQGQVEFITTTAVIYEFLDALSQPLYRQEAVQIWKLIQRTGAIEVTPITQALFEQAVDLYESRRDKKWGITNCMSFVVMNERGISDALAVDADFEQAGFTLLLK